VPFTPLSPYANAVHLQLLIMLSVQCLTLQDHPTFSNRPHVEFPVTVSQHTIRASVVVTDRAWCHVNAPSRPLLASINSRPSYYNPHLPSSLPHPVPSHSMLPWHSNNLCPLTPLYVPPNPIQTYAPHALLPTIHTSLQTFLIQ
jgi:hypothetical protein